MTSSAETGPARQTIIEAVRSPLGWFTLFALIVEALITGGWLSNAVPWWAPFGLLMALLALFSVIVLIKPDALYVPKAPITVCLEFPPKTPVQLDVGRCIVEVRDREGKPGKRRTPNLTWDRFSWRFELGTDVNPADSIRLELVDDEGQRWKVNPFLPYVTSHKPVKIVENQDRE